MPSPTDLPREIGDLAHRAERNIGQFIRDLRSSARISLRELADRAGVSNPYLSQIERGLRRPSAEVLAQLADALRVSTPLMYLRAGLLSDKDGNHSVLTAIAADPELTASQKQSLTQIYETFRRENARSGAESAATAPTATAAPPAATGHAASDEVAAVPATQPTTARPRRTQRGAASAPDQLRDPAGPAGRERSPAAGRQRDAASSGRGRTTQQEGNRS